MSFWGSISCAQMSSVDSVMAMGILPEYCRLAVKEVVESITTDEERTQGGIGLVSFTRNLNWGLDLCCAYG
jgi:hypothetical protein